MFKILLTTQHMAAFKLTLPYFILFSNLKGMSAIDLAIPGSELMNLLVRYGNANSGLLSPRELVEMNGNMNGSTQHRDGRTVHASPDGTESALSVEEVSFNRSHYYESRDFCQNLLSCLSDNVFH